MHKPNLKNASFARRGARTAPLPLPLPLPLLWLPFLFLLLNAGGCALLRSDSDPIAMNDPSTIDIAKDLLPSGAISEKLKGWPPEKWWESYDDPQLNALVEAALAGSPTLDVIKIRAEAAKNEASLTRAGHMPMVGLTGAVDRQHVSSKGFLSPYSLDPPIIGPMLGLTGPWYTTGTVGFTGSYELDVWGKNRAQVNAAVGMQKAKLAEEAQARLTVSSAVTQMYWDMQGLFALRDVLKETRAIEELNLRAEKARHSTGLKPLTDQELAATRLAKLDEQITTLDGGILLLRESLRAMLGPAAPLPEIKRVALPEITGRMPTELGFELLVRRPDLQAARWYIEASLDAVDAARAAFYPNINLLAFFGYDALHLDDLFVPGARQINLLASLSLPIFDSGRLNANLKLMRTTSNISIAAYNSAVVDAVREVSQAAATLQSLETRNGQQAEALAGLDYAARSAAAHHKQGLIDKAEAAQARLPLLVEQGKAIDLKTRWLDAEIAMIKALGGGYRTQTAQEAKEASLEAKKSGKRVKAEEAAPHPDPDPERRMRKDLE